MTRWRTDAKGLKFTVRTPDRHSRDGPYGVRVRSPQTTYIRQESSGGPREDWERRIRDAPDTALAGTLETTIEFGTATCVVAAVGGARPAMLPAKAQPEPWDNPERVPSC